MLSLGEVDEEEKEREHSSMQDQLDKELQELDKRLQQKEVQFFYLNYCGFLKFNSFSASCLVTRFSGLLYMYVCSYVSSICEPLYYIFIFAS